ncbi:MAG: diguanylate cyclase [Anaerolineales bacterium]|nr:diguanylate cyclase [Anaerolineales bacterium]
MSDASVLDPLTGAYTRASFNEHLRASLERAQREQSSCSLLFFDLDHFKSINDAFGHARGDEALIEVARRVRETTRDSDLFFRYGGDEFVLILPDTPKPEAAQLANRLLENIRSRPIGGDGSLTLSISVGVATFPEDTAAENALFEKADARNYEAKRRGRARVVFEEAGIPADLPFTELSRIIERDEALETAQQFLAAILEEQRGVLSVVGEAGSGRSRFLTEVEKHAQLQGFEILSLHGSQRLKGKPYGILSKALSKSTAASPERINLEEFDSTLRRRLAEARREHLLLIVDDMPDLDWGTLDILRQFLAQSSIPVLGLVYASDPDSVRVAAPFWSAVSEHIELRPLSINGLRLWLRILLQWEPPDEFIEWIEKQTSGLPHQVERLLKHLLKLNILAKQEMGWALNSHYQEIGAARQWQIRISPNNLPAALTSFIGRETELAEVRRMIGAARLLTLVGPGGMGKTRLTLQAARESINGFGDGVWFIELAPISASTLLLYTVASVLGVHEEQSRPLIDTLCTWLSDKELLIILDNCEHLLDPVAQFVDKVLRASPNVRILASSREALDIAGELVYRMPALELPETQAEIPSEQLSSYPAVRLFMERAAFADSNFRVSGDRTSLIVQICRQLDGIPLAIELAAARLRTLSVEEIASGLHDRFNLLTKGNRAAMPRHQTLRGLIDWSYDMLTKEEHLLLRRLSTFSGGWTLEAAEQVCIEAGGAGLESAAVLELLQRLANKSIINFDEHAGDPRYSMLETIRQYAFEKLVEAGEENQLRDRHLNHYLNFAERTEPILISARRGEWVRRLEIEHDNLRAALERACNQNAERAHRMAGALGWFWYFGDHLNEGHAWCLRVLALDENAVPKQFRAKAMNSAGMVSGNLGHNEESRSWLEKSISLWQVLHEQRLLSETLFWLSYSFVQLGEDEKVCALFEKYESLLRTASDPLILGWSLTYWGRALETAREDFATAKLLHDESVELGRTTQDINILGTAFMNLGYWAAKQGDYETAYHYHSESSKWHKTDGARLRIAISSHNMADMLSLQGKYLEAQALYEESLALSRALGDQAFIAWTAYRLGYLAVHLNQHERARQLFAESLKLYRAQIQQELLTSPLAGYAELLRRQGNFTQAAHILGFIAAHPQSASRAFLLSIDTIEYDHTLASLRTQLPDEEFRAAWSFGEKMTLGEVIAQAAKMVQ